MDLRASATPGKWLFVAEENMVNMYFYLGYSEVGAFVQDA